ncbi:putative bifunctional diguanylate cyclase/phosphodiesterase [Nucisporomicrobium flavum]|uniref:putative bifunctional diguanylate cyclase/phosphodiesterase n=1 Tax=Nucisporomicrobium flavum TaxID=2785915 RepID=UPI0018F2C085|nr:bifunctional diguanylate cyclase/phosphodiesterase [Nucisporomicrobium flavum]
MSSTRAWRGSRWVTGLLGTLLAVLSGAAVWASWRQTDTVADVVASSAETDAYQQAAYLAAAEMALLQASFWDPDGAARRRIPEVNKQVDDAMARMVAVDDSPDRQRSRVLKQQHLNLGPDIAYYLQQIDRHDQAGARRTLKTVIEPSYSRITARLIEVQTERLAEATRNQAAARDFSRRLLYGSIVVFALGLAVLNLFGWSVRAHRRQMTALAAIDALTGLPNRVAFLAAAGMALTETPRGDADRADAAPPTVLLVNLDGFRAVNDQLGHGIGDRLLIESGRRLAGVVRDDDLVARLGADEFAVLLRGRSDSDEALAARLTTAFDEPFALDDFTVDLEISIGAATAQPGEQVTTLLQHADIALHTAKLDHTGFHRYTSAADDTAAARLSLLGDLRRALDDTGQLILHYQPQIDPADGAITGVEALARWQHPVKGMVSPGDFIPVVENTSLIHRFTDLVLSQALAQARIWHDSGYRLTVAVNISAHSLLDARFCDRVATLLEEAGVPGEMLCIEITESSVMRDPAVAIEALRRIRNLGVRASIDDYGTGYSSMSYLKLLPVNELKIDRSFVCDMATDASSHALVCSAVELGHNLGLTVVAEGVEDAATADALREVGCDLAQGYHFARPMDAEALTRLLRTEVSRQPA